MKLKSNVRISALKWSHVVAKYATWVIVTYLTDVWGLSISKAAGIVNIWNGIENLMQLVFAFLADELMGEYLMLLLSSIIYSIGLGFLFMSTPPVLSNSTHNCTKYKPECIGYTQEVIFYTSLALIAVGISGQAVSLDSFFKENTSEDNGGKDKSCTRNLIRFFVAVFGMVAPVVAGIILPYISSWKIQFGIPALCTLLATLLFISGSRSYKTSRVLKGSPLTDVFRVFVASASKIFQLLPDDNNQLHGKDDESAQNLPYPGLRFLDKAAIISTTKSKEKQEKNKWTLCGVKEVEAAKKLVRMAPLCVTFIICGVVIPVGNTYYVAQANHLNRKLGRVTFPLSLFLAWMELSKMVTSKMYFLMQMGLLKFFKEPERKKMSWKFGIYAPLAVTFWIHIYIGLSSITAAKVETRRLHTIRKHNLLDKPEERIPMSIFWLLPQFGLLGGGEALYKCCIAQFIAYHTPSCMLKYRVFFQKGVMGLGAIGSVLSVYLVGKVSEMGGKPNWFQYTLNKSRLDHYYWTLAVLCAVNFALYGLVIYFYDLKVLLKDEPERDVSLMKEMLAEA